MKKTRTSKKQNRRWLDDAEKKRLVEAVNELTTTLEWTPTQLAQHLGYTRPTLLYSVRKGTASVSRGRFREIMRLHDACVLPEEAVPHQEAAGRTSSKRIARTSATDQRPGNGAVSAPAHAANAEGGVAEKEQDVPPGSAREVGPAKGRPVPSSRRRGRTFPSLLDTPITPRLNQGLPIYVYLQSAREQLDDVGVTLEDAIENASNVLTAPGVREFQKRVRRIQDQLDEALAMG